MQTDNKIFIPDLTPHLEKIRLENKEERDRTELLKLMAPAPPFPEKEMTEEKRKERLEISNNDFWFFDKTYFPKEYYPDYAKAGRFHKELVAIADCKDKKLHMIMGSRSVAKTSMFKKKFIYDMLHGKRRNMAAASETLDSPGFFLLDIIYFLENNERIKYDYHADLIEASSEKIYLRSAANIKGTFVDTLSVSRSSRGRSRGLFLRYDLIFLTDWENNTSSLTTEAVEKRIERLNEMRTSLSDDGTMIAEGNNFDPDCAQNTLLLEEEKGILSKEFVLHVYPAWDAKRPYHQRSLWPQKYPAKSEDELKQLMKPKDEYDWAGNFQQAPVKKSGKIFPREFYNEWDKLPDDIRSVSYTDLNLSLKKKGDTTALTVFGFSPNTQNFYISAARCKSYDNSDDLLSDFLIILRDNKERVRIIDNAFDGNVAQESVWDNNIRNYTRQHGFPFPAITFKKYRVDDLAAPIEAEWKAGKIFFPPGFSKTTEGEQYLKQTFGFISKKKKKTDDAPDSLICAYTFLVEKGIAYINKNYGTEFISVSQRQIHKI